MKPQLIFDVFYAWPTKNLLPKIPTGAVIIIIIIIIMDNATIYKRTEMIEAIEQ